MKLTIETYADHFRVIQPLTDNFYMTANAVMTHVSADDTELALNYYLPLATEIAIDVFDPRPEIEARCGDKIVARRNGYTWEAL